jgi:hypothetical protein
MSTATLLILSARLRGFARADRSLDPAPSVPSFGRGRVTRGAAPSSILFRRIPFRQGPAGNMPPRATLPVRRLISPLACAGARSVSFPRARVLVSAGLLSIAALGMSGAGARAQQAEPNTPQLPAMTLPPVRVEAKAEPDGTATRIGGKPAHNAPCVQVDIAGYRAGHLDCATQRLEEAARIARRDADAARDVSVAQAGSPDVQVGVASRAGTRLRLRENFGVSIRPPVVTTSMPTNTMGRRP